MLAFRYGCSQGTCVSAPGKESVRLERAGASLGLFYGKCSIFMRCVLWRRSIWAPAGHLLRHTWSWTHVGNQKITAPHPVSITVWAKHTRCYFGRCVKQRKLIQFDTINTVCREAAMGSLHAAAGRHRSWEFGVACVDMLWKGRAKCRANMLHSTPQWCKQINSAPKYFSFEIHSLVTLLGRPG